MELQQRDFEIVYRKGTLNHVLDALSRLSLESEEVEEIAEFEEIDDDWYKEMSEKVAKELNKYREWCVEGDCHYQFHVEPLLDSVTFHEESWKFVVLRNYKESVMHDAYCTPASGHPGIEKTFDRVARQYYWRGYFYVIVNEYRKNFSRIGVILLFKDV